MSTKIIDRNAINKDIELYVKPSNKFYNYNMIIDSINKIKTYLIKEKKVKPGQTIMILHGDLYLPWVYACAELGIVLSVSHHLHFKNKELTDLVENLFKEIDFLVSDLKILKELDMAITEYYKDCIDMNISETYSDTEFGDEIYATPESVLVKSISESDLERHDLNPKIQYHTHMFVYDLLERNVDILKIKNSDRFLHTYILHHGPLFAEFFLPSIKYSKFHVWYTYKDIIKITDYIFENNINRVSFLYTNNQLFEQNINKLTLSDRELNVLEKLDIHVIRPPTKDTVYNLVKNYSISYTISFGTTVTAGPLLIHTVNKADYQTYDSHKYEDPKDGFYNITIVDSYLNVQLPDKTLVTTKDTFRITDNKFYYTGYK